VALVGGINELMAEWLMNQSLSLEQLTDEIFYLINMFMAGKN
jgi:hypothetical protein